MRAEGGRGEIARLHQKLHAARQGLELLRRGRVGRDLIKTDKCSSSSSSSSMEGVRSAARCCVVSYEDGWTATLTSAQGKVGRWGGKSPIAFVPAAKRLRSAIFSNKPSPRNQFRQAGYTIMRCVVSGRGSRLPGCVQGRKRIL